MVTTTARGTPRGAFTARQRCQDDDGQRHKRRGGPRLPSSTSRPFCVNLLFWILEICLLTRWRAARLSCEHSWSPLQATTAADAFVLQHLKSRRPGIAPSHQRTGPAAPVLSSMAVPLEGVAISGVSREEWRVIQPALEYACSSWQPQESSPIEDDTCSVDFDNLIHIPHPVTEYNLPIGVTGRVLLLESSHLPANDDNQPVLEELQTQFSQAIDQILFSENSLVKQPVLIAIEQRQPLDPVATALDEHSRCISRITHALACYIDEFGLTDPIPFTTRTQSLAQNAQSTLQPQQSPLMPSMHIEVDGAWVHSAAHDSDESGIRESVWDTSSVLIYDNVLSDDLRSRLLDVVLGRNGKESPTWNDAVEGPDPRRWERGKLADVPHHHEDDDDTGSSESGGYGLTDAAVDDLCSQQHGPIHEFESTILSAIFPGAIVSRLPQAVFGPDISPLTANAPIHLDVFEPHIDADPHLTPPSPWTDVYGRYPNRSRGKPKFMSCLVYLNDYWDCQNWGAPTRIWDVPSGQTYDIEARPGRIVLMDQDITHSVVAPMASAGACRPRYSLVWKLIVHPTTFMQNMRLNSDTFRSFGNGVDETKERVAPIQIVLQSAVKDEERIRGY
jgi:hypothetical protein